VEADFLSIRSGDAGAFLPAMLECIKTKKGNSGNVYSWSIDAEYTTAFMHS
jgi:hypothetical protein